MPQPPSLLLRLFIGVYSAILTAGGVFLPLIAGRKKTDEWDLPDRLRGPVPSGHIDGNVVWIHAASIGEAKLVPPFIEIVATRHPRQSYLLTATTRAGVDYLKTLSGPAIAAAGMLPLDKVSTMQSIISRFGVQRVWLMETELWPSMLWACLRSGIPVGIANARMEEQSFSFFQKVTPVAGALFRHLNPVLAQNQSYAQRFKDLGVPAASVHITGNLKSLISIRRPPAGMRSKLRADLCLRDDDFVVVAGCLHPGEARVVRDAMDRLKDDGIDAACIVVPRHLKASQEIVDELKIPVRVLTELRSFERSDLFVVAKMGVLDSLYMLSDAAFIGGTFVPVGGHNIWEAVRHGVPVFFGPDYHTQTESCRTVVQAGVGFCVKDADGLACRIRTVCRESRSQFEAACDAFAHDMDENRLSVEHLIP